MLKNTSFCILLLVVAASGCHENGIIRRGQIAEPKEKLEEPLQTIRYLISGRHSSGFQHAELKRASKALLMFDLRLIFDVAREGHKCVTWELLLKHTAPEETWPISRDELD